MELHEAPAVYEKVIHYNEAKELQVRLTINTFRGIEYLHVRKYYLDFTEEWKPSPEGVAMELDFNNSRELFFRTPRNIIIGRIQRDYRRTL